MLGLFCASSTTCCGRMVENGLDWGNPVDTWWISSFGALKARTGVWKLGRFRSRGDRTQRASAWQGVTMTTGNRPGGGGESGGKDTQKRSPLLTSRWLATASVAHRLAFEEEMERRRREYSREFNRFWRARRSGPQQT